jgi:hypothetical protein
LPEWSASDLDAALTNSFNAVDANTTNMLNAAQVNVLNGPRLTRYDAALARPPQVASASTASVYNTALPARRGLPQTVVETFASPGQALGVSADRVKILQGRMFNPRAAGQAMIDQQLAGLEHLRPGGTLHLLVIPDNPATGSPEPWRAVPLAFRVSAVVAFDSQIVPATRTNSEPMALLGSPFTRMRLARLSSEGIQTGLRLRPGTSTANSSPPNRAAMSASRFSRVIAWPTPFSSRFPAAWPCWSLKLLKRSRSSITSVTQPP